MIDEKDRLPRILIFRIGDQVLGLALHVVREVIEHGAPVILVPGAPSWLQGMVNHHGQVVPVVDLAQLFDMDPQEDCRQIVLAEVGAEVIGLAVSHVESVEELARPLASQGDKHSWHDGRLLELVDVTRLAGTIERRLVRAGV